MSTTSPKAHGNAKKSATNYEPGAKVRNCWCYSTLCRISELMYQCTSGYAYYLYGDLPVLVRLFFRRFDVRLVFFLHLELFIVVNTSVGCMYVHVHVTITNMASI